MTRRSSLLLALACLGATATALADDEKAWQEAIVEAPARFSLDGLQPFTVSQGSSMQYGIDPGSLALGEDGVVRYVLVARSASGALNVFYEGIRCQAAEVKTYARWDNNRSAWHTPDGAAWKPLSFSGPTRPAMILAKEGLCNGKTANGTPRTMLRALKTAGAYP